MAWKRGPAVMAVAAVVATVVSVSAPGARAGEPNPHAKAVRPAPNTTQPLVDHGGKLLPASNTYAIWWGSASAFPADAATGIAQLLGGFGGSSYLAIANQYMRGGTATSTYRGAVSDPSAPPRHAPSTADLVKEVVKYFPQPDPTAIYFVYTSDLPRLSYCAWHAAGTTATGVTVQVAYLPNTSGDAGCDPGNLFKSTVSEGTRSLADSTAHEYMEATTDPVPVTAWADKNGQEVGDKCNFVYSPNPVVLTNGSSWQIQEEWSNAASGCVAGA